MLEVAAALQTRCSRGDAGRSSAVQRVSAFLRRGGAAGRGGAAYGDGADVVLPVAAVL